VAAGTEGLTACFPLRQMPREDHMADLGSEKTEVQQETAYGAQSDSGAKPGFALSAWSLVIGGVFLVLVLGWLFLI